MKSQPSPLTRPALIAAAMAAIGACGDQVTNPPGPGGLRISTGAGQEDTVLARLATPLVVEYRTRFGQPQSGMTVRIESASSGNYGAHVLLRALSSPSFGITVTDTTDRDGRVTVALAFSQSVGLGWVRATAVDLGLSDSATFVVRPGALAKLKVGPADTAVYVNATVHLRAQTFDTWNNARTDDVRWAVVSGPVETSAGGLVRGRALGRAYLRAEVGTLADSVGLSVVPPGVIAASFFPIASGDRHPVVVFNTDGSGFRQIDVGADCAHGLQWSPTGDQLLFGRNPSPGICFTERLFMATLAGAVTRIRPDTAPLAGEFWPRITADGQWVYFSGRSDYQNGEIWRVRPSGTGAERVGPPAGLYDLDQQPSPSPNGAEVVYSSERDTVLTLRILDVTTRMVRDLNVKGFSPAWSPMGDWIAFVRNDHYYVVHPDGGGERDFVDSRYSAGFPDPPSWSPDGRWIVVVMSDPSGYAPLYGKLGLVEIETGMVLPLGWTAQLTYPAWRASH